MHDPAPNERQIARVGFFFFFHKYETAPKLFLTYSLVPHHIQHTIYASSQESAGRLNTNWAKQQELKDSPYSQERKEARKHSKA